MLPPPRATGVFSVTARPRNDGTWLVQADGIDSMGTHEAFLDGQSLLLRVLDGSTQPVSMPQTAPGHYEARVVAPLGLSAIVSRTSRLAGGGSTELEPQLVARIQSAAVQTAEWPATVTSLSPADVPPRVTILSPSLSDASRWNVPATASVSLTPACWLLAALAALFALWLRR